MPLNHSIKTRKLSRAMLYVLHRPALHCVPQEKIYVLYVYIIVHKIAYE